MTDPVSGNPTGVHRTFLDHTGAKVERRMKGRKGVIRVTPDEGVGHALAIAEGLEDAIAVLLDGAGPVWAACDKDNLKKLPILPGVECLTIFSDRGAGEAEAQACARRWREAGREALVISTYREGGDE